MEVIIWTPADSQTVSVTYPDAQNTAQQIIDIGIIPADATYVEIVDDSTLPTDQTFRDAWRQTGNGKINVDMNQARKLWKFGWEMTLRRHRETMTEAEIDNIRADIGAKAAVLENANSVQALKAIWPDGLNSPTEDFTEVGIGPDDSEILE